MPCLTKSNEKGFLFLIPLKIGDSILEFYAEFNSLFMVKIFLLAHKIIWVLKKLISGL